MNNLIPKDVVKEWGLGNMSEIDRANTVERVGKLLYQAVLVRSLDILTEKEQTAMDELLDQEGSTVEDVLGFLSEKIPTFDILVSEERQKLKEDLFLTR